MKSYTYTENDSGTLLEDTIYETLSVDDWIDLDEDEDVIIGTFPHRIFLMKYVLISLLLLFTSVTVLEYAIELSIAIGLISVFVILYGLFQYWSNFYIITSKYLRYKNGKVVTKSSDSIVYDSIESVSINHSVLARMLSIGMRDFGSLKVTTYGSGDENDVTMKTVPNPMDIKSTITDNIDYEEQS